MPCDPTICVIDQAIVSRAWIFWHICRPERRPRPGHPSSNLAKAPRHRALQAIRALRSPTLAPQRLSRRPVVRPPAPGKFYDLSQSCTVFWKRSDAAVRVTPAYEFQVRIK